MRNRKSALIAGVCTMASVFWLAGCGPKEIENEYVKINRYTGLEVNKITESKVRSAGIMRRTKRSQTVRLRKEIG